MSADTTDDGSQDDPSNDDPDRNETDEPDRPEPERGVVIYGRGVRTALRNNATAYGFSISITAAYGLASGAHGTTTAIATVSFAVGAVIGFLLVGGIFVSFFQRGSLREGGQVLTIGGAVDIFAIAAAVAAAFGLSRVPGFFGWPLTGLGAVAAYLITGGLDVVLARWLAKHTAFGRSQ